MDNKVWDEVLIECAKYLTEQEISTWLKPFSVVEMRGDVVTIAAPNKFYKSWVEDKYLHIIKKIFNESLSVDADIVITVSNTPVAAARKEESIVSQAVHVYTYNTNLNKQYTFETFVVGSSNQFSHAAALGVAEGYFHTYNPLFIYGGVGLGKTHIMHAIGNKLLVKFPKLKVMYVPSEHFTNEMIYSIKSKNMDDFRAKYRNIDVLLFDDVQFLAGKTRSTEEFFYTFNSLYDLQKQIIITSDKTPKEIPEMEDRLTSRFSWGLIADIQPPSTEEKAAILMKRAEILNLELEHDVLYFIAENLKGSNIRELIGALIRLSALSSFHNEKITVEFARRSLEQFLMKQDNIINQDTILDVVASYFNVKVSDLKSKKRNKSISYPRQVGMYLIREKLNVSLQDVGDIFGGRDHSTVLHSVSTIESKLKKDADLKEIINAINRKLSK